MAKEKEIVQVVSKSLSLSDAVEVINVVSFFLR